MKKESTKLPEVIIFQPRIFKDDRGCFLETFQNERYTQAGLSKAFVQDNLSYSRKNVLRGLHYQLKYPQGKLVQVLQGKVYDVVVDIRQNSPHFGQWLGVELSGDNHTQVYIPPGFAHGFLALSDDVIFSYKCTDYYHPDDDYGICWNDPTLAITWPLQTQPLLSPKDCEYHSINDINPDILPMYRIGEYAVYS